MKIDKDRIKRVIPRLKWEAKGRLYHLQYLMRKYFGIRSTAGVRRTLGGSPSAFLRKNLQPVLLAHDSDPFQRILTDTELKESILTAAEHVMRDEFRLLHRYRSVKPDPDGHYPWSSDFFSGSRYPIKYKDYYTSVVLEEHKKHGEDLKGPWELSRLQFAVAPALAWRLTGKAEYAEKTIGLLRDWICVNVPDEGPNWKCAMESGIRAVNMMLAFQLILSYADLTDEFCLQFAESMQEHLRSILWNLENYAGRTYNHYLGDIIGILVITASCSFLRNASRLYSKYRDEFEKEIQRQVLPDGGSFEGSTCYHGLAGEIFALAAVIVENCGERFSEAYYDRLRLMRDFADTLAKPGSGDQPQIGDNDGGRIIEICPHRPLDYSWFLNLAGKLTGGYYADSSSGNLLSMMLGEAETRPGRPPEGGFTFPDFGLCGYRGAGLYVLLNATEAQKLGLGGHTHNDKLSVEINYRGEDFVVDPGSGVYTSDMAIHTKLRSVYAHSTVIVGGAEQNLGQVEGFFGNSHETRCGRCAAEKTESGWKLHGSAETAHGGESFRHRRTVEIEAKRVLISDEIEAVAPLGLQINFVLAPKTEIKMKNDTAELRHGDASLRMKAPGRWETEAGLYSPTYGNTEPCRILFCRLQLPDDGPAEYKTEILLN